MDEARAYWRGRVPGVAGISASPPLTVEVEHRAGISDGPGKATPRGFEPLRAEPNGFLAHLLSHSDKVSCHVTMPPMLTQSLYCREVARNLLGCPRPSARGHISAQRFLQLTRRALFPSLCLPGARANHHTRIAKSPAST
jgi:hypothetical protein